jgi:photosystem II stability/assembly factor-like uncharacterized protein
MARRKPTRDRQRRGARRSRVPAQRFWIAVVVAGAALIAALLAVSFLSDEDGSESDAAAQLGPVHVHGLGVNPADRALYIATHTGMWRLPAGAKEAIPIGESRQDTMGFTIVGPDHFLGSGHPDNLDEPPLLGLIESLDRGATWKQISLAGDADFHVLRAGGQRVYGYDVSRRRLLVSRDGGRTWVERNLRAALLDLVPDPTAARRLVAATGVGLLASTDAGRTWKRVGDKIGLLAWPSTGRLYLATATGDVLLSTSGFGPGAWRRVGGLGGQPSAFFARTARDLFAALHDGTIVQSRDGGRSWRAATSPG